MHVLQVTVPQTGYGLCDIMLFLPLDVPAGPLYHKGLFTSVLWLRVMHSYRPLSAGRKEKWRHSYRRSYFMFRWSPVEAAQNQRLLIDPLEHFNWTWIHLIEIPSNCGFQQMHSRLIFFLQVVKQYIQQSLLEKELLYFGYEAFGITFVDPVSESIISYPSHFAYQKQ